MQKTLCLHNQTWLIRPETLSVSSHFTLSLLPVILSLYIFPPFSVHLTVKNKFKVYLCDVTVTTAGKSSGSSKYVYITNKVSI